MQYLEVNHLVGVPDEYKDQLSQYTTALKHKEILLIVLYFMSDLDDNKHTLSNIEKNMRKIFTRDSYRDYASSNIRGLFNVETQNVHRGLLKASQRYWLNVSEGHWRNSALGNETAKRILDTLKIDLVEREEGQRTEDERKEIQRVERGLDALEGKEREQFRKARVNQGIFREKLLRSGSCCRICALTRKDLLIASHIKAWAASTGKEKVDEDNGLLLCPAHDALFDKHLISFQDDGKIVISRHLTQQDMALLNISPNIQIKVTDGNRKYLRHHLAILKAQE